MPTCVYEARLAELESQAATFRFGTPDKNPWLHQLAVTAWQAGELAKAERYATDALASSFAKKDGGNGVMACAGNTVLGLLAVKQGNLPLAGIYLLASASPAVLHNPGYSQVGPTMALAKALLDRGESGVVLQYLDLWTGNWADPDHKLSQWRTAIGAGAKPEFGPFLRMPR